MPRIKKYTAQEKKMKRKYVIGKSGRKYAKRKKG